MSTQKAAPGQAWRSARLIPVMGIRGQDEQEGRATSTLLAVLRAVPEFGHALLSVAGAPKGKITTFTEVPLKTAAGDVFRPDGAIVVERGRTHWSALVEVKTGTSVLRSDQVNSYLDVRRDHGFDVLITVSRQITPAPIDLPVAVDKRKLGKGKACVFHLSWWRILTEAVVQYRHRGISDPDQAWILGELIAYLEHPNTGTSGFDGMGGSWVAAREGIRQGTLRRSDPEGRDVAARFVQFIDYLALKLTQELGREVMPARARKDTAASRVEALAGELVTRGSLTGGVRIPDAAAAIEISADLRARQLTTSVRLEAPREGRPLSRIKWILRQLQDAPEDLRVEVGFANVRETSSLLLGEARDDPHRLLSASDPKRDPRTVLIALNRPLGLKTGTGHGSFVDATRGQVIDFYGAVVQNLKPWRPSAPRLSGDGREAEDLPAADEIGNREQSIVTPASAELSYWEPTSRPALGERAELTDRG
jgi:hypothetical protein